MFGPKKSFFPELREKPVSGLGADRAMQRVGHEQQAVGLGPIALGVPDRELIGRQQRQDVIFAVAPDRAARAI